MGRLMTGASVDCLPSAGRLLVFCGSWVIIRDSDLAAGGVVRTGSGIGVRFTIWFMESTCPDVGNRWLLPDALVSWRYSAVPVLSLWSMVRNLVAWCGLDRESAHDFRSSPRIQPIPQIDESTALSEVYVDDQNSSVRAAMLVDQFVARGCRQATIWDRNRNQSPILALVLSFGAGLQSGNESSH